MRIRLFKTNFTHKTSYEIKQEAAISNSWSIMYIFVDNRWIVYPSIKLIKTADIYCRVMLYFQFYVYCNQGTIFPNSSNLVSRYIIDIFLHEERYDIIDR